MITAGIPFEQYLKLPGLSNSQLKRLLKSPMHYKYHLDNPDHEPTASQALGSAVHCAILEPERFQRDYVLWDQGTRRGKAWEAFELENNDKNAITASEFTQIKAMRRSVLQFEPAAKYLKTGQAEVTLQWEMLGRAWKGRIDWLTTIDGQPVIVDLKTTKDGTARGFGREVMRYSYHMQLAIYADGIHAITGQQPRVVIIAVENTEPYEPAVYEMQEDVLELGRTEYEGLVRQLDFCERANHWPPAAEFEQRLELPAWAYETEDTDLTDLGLTA